jgi:hypothetical protein
VNELHERYTRISASRLCEILRRYGAHSVVDPLMGLPTHLNYLKRHDFTVHGGELLEWCVSVGNGIVVNDFTVLRDNEVAEIVEMTPGRLYALDTFKAWEGVFFTEEQCVYLSAWHENVRSLRSDGQTGLAVLGLWRVFCYWLQKAHAPDEMEDVAANELAWSYIQQTEQCVASNARRNTIRRADVLETIDTCSAEALFISPPARTAHHSIDPRIWMWEAWWRGNPYFTIEHTYSEALFGPSSSEPAAYARALAEVFAHAGAYQVIVVHTDERRMSEMAELLRSARPRVETFAPHPDEVYLVGVK